jgi:putative endopeptidase
MARLAATISIALVLGACKPAPAPEQGAKAPAEAQVPSKPTLGSFGFDTAGMDKAAVPGDNFFQYANGTWFKNTEIPADRSRYTSFTLLVEKAADREREIIEEAAKDANATGEAALIRDTYNAYMDEAGIEARGL